MNNFGKRIFFGTIYVAILILGCSNQIYISILFLFVGVMGNLELKKLLYNQGIKIDTWPAMVLGICGYISVIYPETISIFIIGLLGYLMVTTFYSNIISFPKIGYTLFSICYIFLPLALAVPIAKHNDKFEPSILISLFILIWASDSWAYVTGSIFGKRKLLEKISPNKTWEGFIGSFLLTCITGGIVGLKYLDISFVEGVFLGGLTSCIGTCGDLFQSMLKRAAKVKDSGNILPGHGGILDRFDSILFCLPSYYVYFYFIRPSILN